MVKDFAFAAYPCTDVATSRRWYEQNLGLQFAGPYVEDGVEKYNEAHFGSGCFSLMWAEWTSRAAGTASSVYFEVDDIDAMAAALEANGVSIDERVDGPICTTISFRDVDGNMVSVHQKGEGR